MAITEKGRKNMYQRLEQVLGEEDAAMLMEHLPPVGWADVATKQDLVALKHEMASRFDAMDGAIDAKGSALRGEISELRAEMYRETRTIVFALIASNATLGTLAFAAARLV
ncbi:hypothetical protein BH20ACT2_BH20ACT2_03410 [soil metagenome]